MIYSDVLCVFITCSGYGIAAQALTAVIRAYDGRGSPTMLTSRILKALGLSSPEEIIGYMTIVIFHTNLLQLGRVRTGLRICFGSISMIAINTCFLPFSQFEYSI